MKSDLDPLLNLAPPRNWRETSRIGGVAAMGGWMPLHFEVDNLRVEDDERLRRVLVVRRRSI